MAVSSYTCIRLRNVFREPTICFMMPSNGHFYIPLTIHAFKKYICPWIGLVDNWHRLKTYSLDSQFVFFSSELHFVKVNRNEEKF